MKNTNGTHPVNTVDIKINITLLHFQLTVIYWRNITLSIFTTFSYEWCIANTRGSLLRIYMPYNLGRICCCSKYFAHEHVDRMWRMRPARLSFFWQHSFCASAVHYMTFNKWDHWAGFSRKRDMASKTRTEDELDIWKKQQQQSM